MQAVPFAVEAAKLLLMDQTQTVQDLSSCATHPSDTDREDSLRSSVTSSRLLHSA